MALAEPIGSRAASNAGWVPGGHQMNGHSRLAWELGALGVKPERNSSPSLDLARFWTILVQKLGCSS